MNKEKIFDLLEELAEKCETSRVCYIRKYDKDGYCVEDTGEDFCEDCIDEVIEEYNKEDERYHYEYEIESSPEDSYFRSCDRCGKMLDSSIIISKYDDDEINYIIEDLSVIETFDDITPNLAWRIVSVFDEEKKMKEYYNDKREKILNLLEKLFEKKGEN